MLKELFLIPNIISLLRILLVFPAVYLIIYYNDILNTYIIILIFIIWLTDILDGFLARKLEQISELGKIIDPVADKFAIFALTITVFLKKQYIIPFWFILVIILRDILILAFGLYLKRKTGVVLMSNYPGKITALLIAAIIFFAVINNELFNSLISYSVYIATVTILISTYLYFKRFIKTLGEKKHGKNSNIR